MIKVQNFKIETELVPSPVKYSVLYPSDYETSDKIYPLMLFLHGGNGPKGFVNQIKTIIRNLWENKLTPEMVIVIPHCDRSFYMDYRNGSQKWETFILNELIPHLQVYQWVGWEHLELDLKIRANLGF